MARIYGLNGVLRGRQGNNVFSVQNGTQVVKAYQPAVSNPRTSLQVIQRTKFALAGRMSSATPTAALSGMGGDNARAKRARFVQLLTRSITTVADGAGYRASINLQNVIYSEGSMATYSTPSSITAAWAGTAALTRNNIRVTINLATISSLAPVGYAEMYIAALYDTETNNLEVCTVRERAAGQTGLLEFDLRAGYNHNCFVAVYQVPFARLSDRARPVTSYVGADDTTAFLLESQNALVMGSEWGRSVLLTNIPVLGTDSQQNNAAPIVDDNREVVAKKK